MKNSKSIQTHTDGVWVSTAREIEIKKSITQVIQQQEFDVTQQDSLNHGYPYIFARNDQRLHCRVVDSVFLSDPDAVNSIVITDNILIPPNQVQDLISVVPEFWHIWYFDPVYIDREPTWGYNCFMNRARGDRSMTYYELIKRNILSKGLVSFNLTQTEYQQQFVQAELFRYNQVHTQASVPYNNLTGTLEQCIIDSNVSLVLETYISDSHAVFSEKIFRCLQMPRPWLLYCSPGSVGFLRNYGFDVLDDCVDHSYDQIKDHGVRLNALLNQLETFIDQRYNEKDYVRFKQAVEHNQCLLKQFEQQWPDKLNSIVDKIKQL